MSWKDGLLTASQMRRFSYEEERDDKVLSLIKKVLEVAKKSPKNHATYFVLDNKKHYLLPEVVSRLCELGYDASFVKKDINLVYLYISW